MGHTAAVYIFFTLSPEDLPALVLYTDDNLMHFLTFLLLTLLSFQAFFNSRFSLFRQNAVGKAALFSTFYGAFLEWLQTSVPGRTGSFSDWIVDLLGVLLAALIFRFSRLTLLS